LICLGSFLAAALMGGLVLARSMPLVDVIQGRQRLIAHASAFLTALMAAGLAGLAAFLVLSAFFK